MESTKRAIKFQLNESKVSLSIFWLIIIIVDIFSIIMSQIADINIGLSDISVGINVDGYGQGLSLMSLMALNFIPIIIYLITRGYELYYKNFPIALSFSVTRKDFFKSMIINNILIAFVASIIQSFLMKADPIIVEAIGKKPFYEFGLFNTQSDNILFIMITIFIIATLFIAIWNLIAALNYRFGPKFWIVLGIIVLLLQIVFSFNLVSDILSLISSLRIDILQFIVLLVISISFYTATYFVTINTDIKNKA